MKIYLIGTGPMAIEYAKVLTHMNLNVIVIGRGIDSANNFKEKTGLHVEVGGFSKYCNENVIDADGIYIIATGTEVLMSILLLVQKLIPKAILVEKPAAISPNELLENAEILKEIQDITFVAYNRRYYESVTLAKKLIEEDGGLTSFHFDFTEWSHKIDPLHKAAGVKENWLFANSTHVIDLAFFLGGLPEKLSSYSRAGNIEWHEKSQFVGAGVSNNNIPFSYHSNWESAGRWGVFLYTNKRKFILEPLEDLSIQERGQLSCQKVYDQNKSNSKFKPGLFKMIEMFINSVDDLLLPSLKTHINFTSRYYSSIISNNN